MAILLAERKEQKAGTLSGGEQQMLTIVRVLMTKPKFLLLDEPASGITGLGAKAGRYNTEPS